MRRVSFQSNWPESWKQAYAYDLLEVYGEMADRGYAYAYDNRRRTAMRLLSDVLYPGASVLDVGAAQGNFSLALAEQGYKVTWNDIRGDLVDYVLLKYEAGRIEFAPGDAFALEFSHAFDAVLIAEVIEHVAYPEKFLANSARFVRPGGYVVMTTPNGAYAGNRLPKFGDCANRERFLADQFKPDADGHIFLLHPEEIPSLASFANLEIEEIVLFSNPLTNGFLKTQNLLSVLPRAVVDRVERATQRLSIALASRIQVQMGVRFRNPVAS